MSDALKLSPNMGKCLGALALVTLLLVGTVAVWPSTAAGESEVGFIDDEALVSEYLNAVASSEIQAIRAETERLQAKFDEERQGLDPGATDALFSRYEAELRAYEQQIFEPFLAKVEAAIEQAAEAHGVTVVLNSDVVVLGGIDLTQPVREILGLAGN